MLRRRFLMSQIEKRPTNIVEKVDAAVQFPYAKRDTTTIGELEDFIMHARLRGADGTTEVKHLTKKVKDNSGRGYDLYVKYSYYVTGLEVSVPASMTGVPLYVSTQKKTGIS